MKKLFNLTLMVALVGVLLTSCGGENSGSDAKNEFNSSYFEQIVFAEGGHFVGLSIGDTREAVKAKLPADAFEDETDSYLYYTWSIDGNDYYLDLFFKEDGKLSSIDGFVYFYSDDTYYDKEAATAFYTDLKGYFTAKFGQAEEEVDGDYQYTYWYMDEMDAEVGVNEGEVYWYIYGYSSDFSDFSFEEEVDGEDAI
jgi:hypothetical protein